MPHTWYCFLSQINSTKRGAMYSWIFRSNWWGEGAASVVDFKNPTSAVLELAMACPSFLGLTSTLFSSAQGIGAPLTSIHRLARGWLAQEGSICYLLTLHMSVLILSLFIASPSRTHYTHGQKITNTTFLFDPMSVLILSLCIASPSRTHYTHGQKITNTTFLCQSSSYQSMPQSSMQRGRRRGF